MISTGGPSRPSPISPASWSGRAWSRSGAVASRFSYSFVPSFWSRSTRSRRPTWASLRQRDHHVLELRVLLDRVDRHVVAVAGLLEAAVRHLGDERDVVVHPHGAELQPAGYAHRAAHVAGPDARGQAVVDVVRPRHRLVLRREALHRHHRAEHLTLDHLVALLEVRDHRRLEPVPRLRGSVPTGHGLGVGRQALEEALHAL